MKTRSFFLLLVWGWGMTLGAQTPAPTPPPPAPLAAELPSAGDLETLLAPIALYPDALVALMLPAAAVSSDIVLAARFLASNQDVETAQNQPWDESVQALVRFPEIVKWMDSNLEWTRALGAAFVAQPVEVMNAIQRLRVKARASGALVDTPQHKVVMEDNVIRIVPADPDIIYVPYYDPAVAFVGPFPASYWVGGPAITFGLGFAIGSWLYYDCDWRHHSIWIYHRYPGWVYRPTYRPPVVIDGKHGRHWHPHKHRYAHHHHHHRRPAAAITPPRSRGSDHAFTPSGENSRSSQRRPWYRFWRSSTAETRERPTGRTRTAGERPAPLPAPATALTVDSLSAATADAPATPSVRTSSGPRSRGASARAVRTATETDDTTSATAESNASSTNSTGSRSYSGYQRPSPAPRISEERTRSYSPDFRSREFNRSSSSSGGSSFRSERSFRSDSSWRSSSSGSSAPRAERSYGGGGRSSGGDGGGGGRAPRAERQ